jgi:hypothetical protein
VTSVTEMPTKASNYRTAPSSAPSVSRFSRIPLHMLTCSLTRLAPRRSMGSAGYAQLPVQAIQTTHLHDRERECHVMGRRGTSLTVRVSHQRENGIFQSRKPSVSQSHSPEVKQRLTMQMTLLERDITTATWMRCYRLSLKMGSMSGHTSPGRSWTTLNGTRVWYHASVSCTSTMIPRRGHQRIRLNSCKG